MASGGKCGPGALSGAVGSFATPLTRGLDFTSRLVAVSTIGGLASVAGGGKFANGATTAAFGYLFNELGNNRQRGYEESIYGDEVCNGPDPGCVPIDLTDPLEWSDSIAIGGIVGKFGFAIYDTINRFFGGTQRPQGIPRDWIESASKKGGGKVYTNPGNQHDSVRVMPGSQNSPNPSQRGPYVKDNLDGRFLTTEGGRVPSGKLPETHIPFKDYKFGR